MKSVIGILLACALGLAGSAAARCGAPIVMGTGQLEPYGYFDAQKRYVGMDVELIRAITAEAGCTLSFAPLMPDGRNLLLFEQGKIDLMAGASRTAERLKWSRFSIAYRQETIGLYAVADGRSPAVLSFADFVAQPLSLLAPRAGWYGAEYERHKARLKAGGRLSQFDNLAQGVRMLAARRAQFILGDAAGVEHAAARLGVTVRPLPFWLVEAPVHLMLSRATMSEADVAQLDAAIVRLRQRGVLDQIQRGYGAL
jgi:polar amino acid transport system substrate-binding protein